MTSHPLGRRVALELPLLPIVRLEVTALDAIKQAGGGQCALNAVVGAAFGYALTVTILTTPAEIEALKLQPPLPDCVLTIVARGERIDESLSLLEGTEVKNKAAPDYQRVADGTE